MNKNLSDLIAGLEYSKSMIKRFDTIIAEGSGDYEYNCEQRGMWWDKMKEYERLIEESSKILEG